MKQILIGLVLLGLLAGCGAQQVSTPPEDSVPETPETVQAPPPVGLSMTMEHPVYDPSLTSYTYFIENRTEEIMEFGEAYRIQYLSEDAWLDLKPKENWGFTAIGYILEPGGEMALTCTLDMYERPPEPGLYRLVKSVGDAVLYAEFQLGESIYTAETPYGFGPLEDLPSTYGADTADAGCVIFSGDGAKNLEAAEEFLHKACLRAPCQLRVVQDYGEGTPMVTDAIYKDGRFTWRLWSGDVIAERYFSYVVTDGQELYLSNGADWASGEKYGDLRTLLIPEGAAAEMVSAVKKMTGSRLEGNVTRYRIWSGDGIWDAALTDTPAEFSVGWQKPGEGSRGCVYNLQDWDGLETAVTALAWQADGTLLLTCETSVGGASKLFFDPETERLTSGELCGLPLAEDAVSGPSER